MLVGMPLTVYPYSFFPLLISTPFGHEKMLKIIFRVFDSLHNDPSGMSKFNHLIWA